MTVPEKAPSREIFGWAMFDFANQAYTTLIITVVFGVMFTRVIVGDEPDFRTGNLLWSISLCLSYALVAALAPITGAIMDHSGVRKKFLFISWMITILATAGLYWITPGLIIQGMLLIIISNTAYSLGESFIASSLPLLGPPRILGRISGLGWALGYMGGLLATGLVLLGLGEISLDNFENLRLTGPIAALFFLLGALPTFAWLRQDRPAGLGRSAAALIKKGLTATLLTAAQVRHYRDLSLFLMALFFAMAGLYIVISFTFIYGDQIIGWDPEYQMLMFVFTQISAAAGAVLFGILQDRIGAGRTFNLTLLLWIICITLIYFTRDLTSLLNHNLGTSLEPQQLFLLVGCLAGSGLGSVQSCARTMVGMFTPKHKTSEFFGFWTMTLKLAAMTGILGLGILQNFIGLEASVLLCILFFSVSLLISLAVNEQNGLFAAGNLPQP